MNEKDLIPPKPTTVDMALTAVKGGASSIPGVGGLINALIDIVCIPPLERRRDEWRNKITESIQILITKNNVTINELQNNEQFIDIIMKTTQIAISTSDQTKINALKNAVLNSVYSTVDRHKQQIFLSYVDSFTDWHLEIVLFYRNPYQWLNNKGKDTDALGDKPPIALFKEIFDNEGDSNVYFQIINDLYSRGLLLTDNRNILSRNNGMFDKRTSEFGDEFIDYIMSDPTI